MSRNPPTAQGLGPSTSRPTFGQVFRRYFVTGLAALFPLWVTVWLLVWIFQFADRLLGRYFGFRFPGLGLLVTLLVILGVGVLSVHFFGRVLLQTIESGIVRIPFVKKIYPAAKQLSGFLFKEEGSGPSAFRRVVLVAYPRPGSYSIAFVTNEWQTTMTGSAQTMLTLLIPTPPSPLTGPIIFVPEHDVVPLDLSVEDAFTLVVSGGVVAPPLNALAASKSE